MSHREEQSAADRVARRRVWCYVIVAAGITLGCIGLQFTTWHTTPELHTVMEAVATTLAFVVAAAAPFRYYSERDNKFLFIGTGFFVTALLDGYHTIVTGVAFRDYFPSPPESLTAWSWTSSRTFLGVLMVVSWWVSQRPRQLHLRAGHVYGVMTLLTAAIFLLFAFVPLAQPRPLGTLFGHPEELLIGCVFLVALIGFLRAGNWRRDDFSHWLVLALIVSVVCQAVVKARSFQSHDAMFDVAHLLKIASYGCVLAGLLISTYRLYANVEDGVRRLLDSEERFQLAVRGTADGLWDWDLASNAVWYSPRVRELLGYRGDDDESFPPLLETFNRHLHPEDSTRAWAAVKQHIADDHPYDIEYRLRTKSGQWRWFRARGACVRDHEGRALRMAGSIRDIQELHEAGQTLRQMERRLDQALKGANVGLWDWNLETGDVYFSPQMKIQLGHDPEEAWSDYREWESRLHEDDREEAVARVKNYLSRASDEYTSTFRLRHKDGSYRWILSQGKAEWNAAGEPRRIVGVHVDITEQRQLAEKLSASNAELAREQFLLKSLVENIPDPIFFKDLNSRFIRVNQTMARDVGASDPKELIGKSDADIWAGDFWKSTYADEQELMKTGVPLINREENPRVLSGQQHWVLVTKMPLYDENGQIVGLFGVARDITKLKLNEHELERINRDLERSNAELEHFAYVASHDLRSPLRNIDSLTRWILEDVGDMLPAASRNDLLLLRQRVELMNRLLNDLLQYSRVGRIESDPEDIDPGQIVAEVIELVGIPPGFRLDVQPNMPHVHAPRTAIRKVFQNMVDNAIKHHHRTEGVIEIRAADRGTLVEFVVRDDGPGVDPKFHEKVFQIFQTLQRRDDLDTSGMGLAIVKKTVEKYGGQIKLASQVGHGATFSFTWPKDSTPPFSL
ncbi:MAG TPA: PAS domain-containing protein [Pirellulaceae bacterium]|nr:PAS domain-containing protein [Pirellulaceae bacterium]